jgi:hypothetical protein
MNCSRCLAIVASAALWMLAMPVLAQDTPAPSPGAQPVAGPPMSQDLLDSLLAPIALYPDQLLTQVLMASTYPLEVVQAARFVKANPNLTGAALDDALQDQTWDPSVLSLAAFPQVLDMMNEHLDWTQRLGDAFLNDEAAVMRTVQSLRLKAQQAGNLQSNEQQKIIVQERTIIIEPAQPQYVFVPVYNPTVVFGPWWAPAYRPWFWYPPPIWGFPPYQSGAFVAGVFWGRGWAITSNNWGWSRPNWNNNTINININNNNRWVNRPQYRDRNRNGNWNHSPDNRRGVAYRDRQTSNRYRPTNDSAVRSRDDFRGRDNASRPGTGNNASRPGGNNASRPGTGNNVSRPGGGNNVSQPGTGNIPSRQGGGNASRPGGANNASRPGGGNNVSQPGTGNIPSRPGGGNASRPGTGNNASRPGGGNNVSRPASPVRPESRPQVQRDQNRGAQSRASMQQPSGQRPPSGGNRGGGGGGGGGGQGRGGGGGGGGGGQGRGR